MRTIPKKKPKIKKYNSQVKKGNQGQKTRITHERAETIRNDMEKPADQLTKETGLSKYVIKIIKEAKRNNFWRKSSYQEGLHKGDKISDDMEDWLAEADYQNANKMTIAFNQEFNNDELTPMSYHTVKKLHEKLKTRENFQN